MDMDSVLDRKTSLNSDFLGWMKSSGTTGSKICHHQHQQTNPHRPFSHGDEDDAGPTNEAAVAGATTPGGGVAAGFPFTGAQWKELERQAMIYKCMISGVPVPPHLLFPCGRKGDPEAGRCKRTDGKKWRCSREVAPQQKYCERHLHRGRPRSRKPVEPNYNKTTRVLPKTDYNQTNTLFSSKQPLQLQLQEDLSYPEIDLGLAAVESPSLDLSMAMAVGNQIDAPVSWDRGGPLAEALPTFFSHSTFWL